jgi:CheY-like chemotaxis protein
MAVKKILFVDDEQELLDIYASKLEEVGYAVVCASNGAEGLQKAKAEKPDLILMDLKMPGMNGIEVFEKLKEDPELQNVKVAFLTAFSDPSQPQVDKRFAKEIGATDFLRKGMDLNELVNKIKLYLAD